jgi:hypothetical protein
MNSLREFFGSLSIFLLICKTYGLFARRVGCKKSAFDFKIYSFNICAVRHKMSVEKIDAHLFCVP